MLLHTRCGRGLDDPDRALPPILFQKYVPCSAPSFQRCPSAWHPYPSDGSSWNLFWRRACVFASASASAPPQHTVANLFVSKFYGCLTTLSVVLNSWRRMVGRCKWIEKDVKRKLSYPNSSYVNPSVFEQSGSEFSLYTRCTKKL